MHELKTAAENVMQGKELSVNYLSEQRQYADQRCYYMGEIGITNITT